MPVLGVTEPMLTGGQTSAEGAGAVIYLAALEVFFSSFVGVYPIFPFNSRLSKEPT